MNLYWTNRCKENNFRCPKCGNMIGDKNGQMPISSKNHKIQMYDGQVKCVVCNTTIGYFSHKSEIEGVKVRAGAPEKILKSIEHITGIKQEGF